ncbi:hypothetical protein Snoj_17710 [Streptomyces nojiriensis]|uniref:Transcription regulator MerR DNA binding domain-containing protein n=1 Tax=Streptomyces nojiriensis TaxID=66374 RepID=A0ABQ3SI80_9ACTN|nr:hypothetical protein GCM10010205_76740 [Streptomyces nojiriensis]GHI67853.1 hypothetical protein Snoj_17710 [Streptomyces nojiriensis]
MSRSRTTGAFGQSGTVRIVIRIALSFRFGGRWPREPTAETIFTRDAQGAGLTLAEIRSVPEIRDSGQAPCGQVTSLIDQRLTDIALRELARRAAATDPGTCSEGEVCTILTRP